MPDRPRSVVGGGRRFVPKVPWQELFELRARACPKSTALVADDVAWTFGDLRRWSGRLAHALRAAGVAPGSLVACAMSRSVRAILAPLAVAKAGAVYLPLDPGLPPARRAAILGQARPAALLTDVADLAAEADVVLSPDDWRGELAHLPEHADAGPARAAYVIYTSGSTGRPKGVVVGHRSLVNLYCELAARLFPAGGEPQRVAHGLPLAFDASWNPLLWLLGGHEVHLVPDDVRADPEHYVRFARERRLSVVEAVPTQLTALLDAGLLTGDDRPGLLLMGGEAVAPPLWSRLRATPGLAAVNLYGPTECTVFTTYCRLAEHDTPAIGRPIANTGVQVVDAELRPVPVGEAGELLVGGTSVALGYLDDPVLTARRFGTAPPHWYRTGDRCRVEPDGTLRWLGRADDQVKINGHRVEPGEAEQALLALPGVRQALVRAEGTGDRKRLVGYVVLGSGTVGDLREHLLETLPAYCVPALVEADALPVGRTGKIDRTADRVAPRRLTPAETVVAAAFRSQLGITVVAGDSDFFALGGHSLSAAALAAWLRARGVPCSLRDVLRRRTVAQLAELVPSRPEGGA
ncbi:amino acid adenylation domain-containing protein [Amycolatopsis sp. SID8362]|uniref:amino acid adenylation domain-containing protein n=1 Tax=Amycolatopsis sp. SID8362 TaxID=2690346 RepID=UPI00136D7C3A|nr:amino acid adenylation domain-containing protein [Amycolatopsis sp. SID8362]NBH07211.1 amino acid adenylation domain-containing protein [Amycolatopsis sp. SID8362]NED43907.1 amino acid adenylation domain-containing protein [Amycolatopsis sp. SID8362]